MLKLITRREAEDLFDQSKIVRTELKQDSGELFFVLTYSDKKQCMVEYDSRSGSKNYFLNAE
ncbi:hypothetical protein JW906_06460 [bacterium]|nr:hypothetical protein [bacterium]